MASLRDLPQDVQPARDLWPGIEARLESEARSPAPRRRQSLRQYRYAASLAAVLVAVMAGIWIDRMFLSHGLVEQAGPAGNRGGVTAQRLGPPESGGGVPVSYLADPRYVHARAALLGSLSARLAALPPQSRQRVIESLDTIHRSMQEIQTALGRDPGNALLQELLVDTCQDEMRVLTSVQANDHSET